MRIGPGDTALVTGASRGIGRHIAIALAQRGADVVLVARGLKGLADVAAEVRDRYPVSVSTLTADLADRDEATSVIARAEKMAAPVSILVNNAGLETTRRFDERHVDEIAAMTDVNLLAPMLLSRSVLPGMIARRRGHIVNIASIAGLLPSAYEEPYNATKFGLVGFTRSLRLTARDRGWHVSASAICPGFMEGAGMYDDMRSEFGITAPRTMKPQPVVSVGAAVVKAVERDLPEVLIMGGAPRLTVTAANASPRLFERLAHRMDLAATFRAVADQRGAAADSSVRRM
jgi:short-subunit dehydrogenase